LAYEAPHVAYCRLIHSSPGLAEQGKAKIVVVNKSHNMKESWLGLGVGMESRTQRWLAGQKQKAAGLMGEFRSNIYATTSRGWTHARCCGLNSVPSKFIGDTSALDLMAKKPCTLL
jgi:hypothetical protein